MVSWDRFWYGLRERSTQDCFRVKAYVHVNCSIDDDLRNRARGSVCELLASCVTRIHSTSASGASDMFSVKIRHQAQIDSAANSCWRFYCPRRPRCLLTSENLARLSLLQHDIRGIFARHE